MNNVLFRINYDYVFFRCLEKSKAKKVLWELHDGPSGGHFGGDTTTHKTLHAKYYWPIVFKYAHDYVRKCNFFQIGARRQRKTTLPLQ